MNTIAASEMRLSTHSLSIIEDIEEEFKMNVSSLHSSLIREINNGFNILLNTAMNTSESLDRSITCSFLMIKNKVLLAEDDGSHVNKKARKTLRNFKDPGLVDAIQVGMDGIVEMENLYNDPLDAKRVSKSPKFRELNVSDNFQISLDKENSLSDDTSFLIMDFKVEPKHIDGIAIPITPDDENAKDDKYKSPTSNLKCQECDSSFTRKDHLVTHINSKHEDMKKFLCENENCSSSFTRKDHLITHVKSKHSDSKEFVCDYGGGCTSSFTRKDHLKIHIKSKHSNTKEFECESCSYSTSRRDHFKSHNNNKHKLHPM